MLVGRTLSFYARYEMVRLEMVGENDKDMDGGMVLLWLCSMPCSCSHAWVVLHSEIALEIKGFNARVGCTAKQFTERRWLLIAPGGAVHGDVVRNLRYAS